MNPIAETPIGAKIVDKLDAKLASGKTKYPRAPRGYRRVAVEGRSFIVKQVFTVEDLPYKLSEMIRLAVYDISRMEKSKGYIVEMGHWHYNLEPGDNLPGGMKCEKHVCAVCFAGSVMSRFEGVQNDPEKLVSLGVYPESQERIQLRQSVTSRMYALNSIRVYDIQGAITWMYGGTTKENLAFSTTKEQRKRWKESPYPAQWQDDSNHTLYPDFSNISLSEEGKQDAKSVFKSNMLDISDQLETIGL